MAPITLSQRKSYRTNRVIFCAVGFFVPFVGILGLYYWAKSKGRSLWLAPFGLLWPSMLVGILILGAILKDKVEFVPPTCPECRVVLSHDPRLDKFACPKCWTEFLTEDLLGQWKRNRQRKHLMLTANKAG